MEPGGCDQAVAAIVSWAAGHPDVARMGRKGQDKPGYGLPRPGHQGVGWQARCCSMLQRARGRRVVQRLILASVDLSHRASISEKEQHLT
jgi:hypothetical protein